MPITLSLSLSQRDRVLRHLQGIHEVGLLLLRRLLRGEILYSIKSGIFRQNAQILHRGIQDGRPDTEREGAPGAPGRTSKIFLTDGPTDRPTDGPTNRQSDFYSRFYLMAFNVELL